MNAGIGSVKREIQSDIANSDYGLAFIEFLLLHPCNVGTRCFRLKRAAGRRLFDSHGQGCC